MSFVRAAIIMALLLASITPATAQQSERTIVVWSFGFSPQPIALAAGEPVTLVFQNRSGRGHDFTAKAFFQSSSITSGAAPDGEIELRPHETKRITLVPRAGSYKAHCSHFMHAMLGMSDQILVR